MKRITILLFLFYSSIGIAQSPFLDWMLSAGGVSYEHGFSVAADEAGNVYMCGSFSYSIDIDPGAGVHTLNTYGGSDYFIAKFTVDGGLIWAKSGGGSSNEFARTLAYRNGHLYLGTQVSDTSFIDLGDTSVMVAEHDIMIEQMDTAGNTNWLRFIDSDLGGEASGMAIDGSGNIYTVGYFYAATDFDPGPGTFSITSTGSGDAFILKLDSLGNFLWASSFQSTSYGYGMNVACDTNDNVIVVGEYQGSTDLDPSSGTLMSTSEGLGDIFISKLDSSGNFIWGKSIGGDQHDSPDAVCANSDSQIYVVGSFREDVDFDPGPTDSIISAVGTNSDAFILKLADNGDFEWAKTFGNFNQDFAHDIDIDTNDNIYITGRFAQTIDFDPGIGVQNLTAQATDMFILKLGNNGEYAWAVNTSGTINDGGNGIDIDQWGNVFVAGEFNGIIEYGPYTGEMNLDAIGTTSDDAVLFKYTQCASSPLLPTMAVLDSLTGNCFAPFTMTYTAINDCGVIFYGVPSSLANELEQGINVVTWTYDDGSGNILNQPQIVTLNDTVPPFPLIANLPPIADDCPIGLNPPLGNDECAGTLVGTTSSAMITTPGVNIVVWTYTDENGNTFTQNQTVTYIPINNTILVFDGKLKAQQSGGSYSYQWLDCENGMAIIPGENNQTFLPPDDGSYAVQVGNGQCHVVSDCMSFAGNSEDTFSDITVFPNPIATEFSVSQSEQKSIQLKLYDAQGQLVLSLETQEIITTINTAGLADGVYYLEINSDESVSYFKLVK